MGAAWALALKELAFSKGGGIELDLEEDRVGLELADSIDERNDCEFFPLASASAISWALIARYCLRYRNARWIFLAYASLILWSMFSLCILYSRTALRLRYTACTILAAVCWSSNKSTKSPRMTARSRLEWKEWINDVCTTLFTWSLTAVFSSFDFLIHFFSSTSDLSLSPTIAIKVAAPKFVKWLTSLVCTLGNIACHMAVTSRNTISVKVNGTLGASSGVSISISCFGLALLTQTLILE